MPQTPEMPKTVCPIISCKFLFPFKCHKQIVPKNFSATSDLYEEHFNIFLWFYTSLVVYYCMLLDQKVVLYNFFFFSFFKISLFGKYCLPYLFTHFRCLFNGIRVSVLHNVFLYSNSGVQMVLIFNARLNSMVSLKDFVWLDGVWRYKSHLSIFTLTLK